MKSVARISLFVKREAYLGKKKSFLFTRYASRDTLHASRIPNPEPRFFGFTLLELIISITLLALLAAFAIPRFLDATSDSRSSATKAVAGALGAASANNYGVRKANSSKGSAVTNCTDIGSLSTGLLPSGYTITSLAIAADATATCTVTNPDGSTTATFTGLGIS